MCNVPRSPKPSYISMIWPDRAVATWARANGDANGGLRMRVYYALLHSRFNEE